MTGQPNRLPHGGEIDRSLTLDFTFDGKPYQGHPGDTLASALLANGVSLLGRSFKYHRPRGLYSIGPEEPNALAEIREVARREPRASPRLSYTTVLSRRVRTAGHRLLTISGL